MNFELKYIKYKSKYLNLKNNFKLKGGFQFFVKLNVSGQEITKTIDVDEVIKTNYELIDKIRKVFVVVPEAQFKIIWGHNVVNSTEIRERNIDIRENVTMTMIPEIQKNIDYDGEIILEKIFKYLERYNEDDKTQIIVVPFSSNTEMRNVKKNIIQQFQPLSIKETVDNLIYVLFDSAFFQNINAEFFDYVQFENQDTSPDFILTSKQETKIKKFFKSQNTPFLFNNKTDVPATGTPILSRSFSSSSDSLKVATLKNVAASSTNGAASSTSGTTSRTFSGKKIPEVIFDNYIEEFLKTVAPIIINKNVTFYVINFNRQRNFDFVSLCDKIDNCIVRSFEGEKYDVK
jgi:hypothetical protein